LNTSPKKELLKELNIRQCKNKLFTLQFRNKYNRQYNTYNNPYYNKVYNIFNNLHNNCNRACNTCNNLSNMFLNLYNMSNKLNKLKKKKRRKEDKRKMKYINKSYRPNPLFWALQESYNNPYTTQFHLNNKCGRQTKDVYCVNHKLNSQCKEFRALLINNLHLKLQLDTGIVILHNLSNHNPLSNKLRRRVKHLQEKTQETFWTNFLIDFYI